MKPFFKLQITLFTVLLIGVQFTLEAQTIALPNEWKFKLGDDMNWAIRNFRQRRIFELFVVVRYYKRRKNRRERNCSGIRKRHEICFIPSL